jgi:hypothetical protein
VASGRFSEEDEVQSSLSPLNKCWEESMREEVLVTSVDLKKTFIRCVAFQFTVQK